MNRLFKGYQWIDNLSLDVVAGAVLSSYYFSKLGGIEVSPFSLIVLGLAVWIIYTADHLKDGSRINSKASSVRHQFHQQNFKTLYILVIFAGVAVILLVLNLDKYTLLWGLKLSLVVLIYLAINHYLSYTKELTGGLLYCAGVLLPTLSQLESPMTLVTRIEVMLFCLLVITNLLLFSSNELSEDLADKHKSFALYFGKPITRVIIKCLLAITAILLAVHWNNLEFPGRIIFSLMLFILLIITLFPTTFEKNDRYRFWGDLIFVFPAIVFLA